MRAVTVLCSLMALGAAAAQVHILPAGENIYFDRQTSHMASYYGDTVTIFCSGTNATKVNLTRIDSEDKETIEIVNATTVKLTLKDLAIGIYKYICDEETSRAELRAYVHPALTVISQNVLYRNTDIGRMFFVPIGESYEVLCSSSSKPLRARILRNGKETQTLVVNHTSIKTAKEQEIENIGLRYTCLEEPDYFRSDVIIYVDELPTPKNFQCVLNQGLTTCNWNVRSSETTSTLFYSDLFRNSVRVCEVSSNKNSINCGFNTFSLLKHGISLHTGGLFILESCNLFVCINETFNEDSVLFTKAKAPSDLKMQDTSASQAVISWRVEEKVPRILQYKVTYQTPGTAASELNELSLQVTCKEKTNEMSSIVYDCVGKLKLPCPGTRYEIEVYVKDSACPGTNDACWSDPGTIILRTGKRGNSTVDPACDEPIRNKYVAMYKIQEFGRSFEKEMSALREKVQSMKNKLEKIMKLCRELGLDECENFVLYKSIGK